MTRLSAPVAIVEPDERPSRSIAPHFGAFLLDPSAPIRGDLGLRADARHAFGNRLGTRLEETRGVVLAPILRR